MFLVLSLVGLLELFTLHSLIIVLDFTKIRAWGLQNAFIIILVAVVNTLLYSAQVVQRKFAIILYLYGNKSPTTKNSDIFVLVGNYSFFTNFQKSTRSQFTRFGRVPESVHKQVTRFRFFFKNLLVRFYSFYPKSTRFGYSFFLTSNWKNE